MRTIKDSERDRRNADLKRNVVDAFKLAKGCIDCGYKENAAALEFDHLPGFRKNATVASLMYRSLKVIVEEIKKCEVVCANCHAIRTYNRR